MALPIKGNTGQSTIIKNQNKSYKYTQVDDDKALDLAMLSVNKANKWFMNAIKSMKKDLPPELIDIYTRKYPPIGELVMYIYDPKLKATLPYYDQHPLILCVGVDDTGFYGLNLHYIQPVVRKKLIKVLSKEKERSSSPKEYIKRVVPILSRIAGDKAFQHVFKHYLKTHVRSKIGIVEVSHWNIVAVLPFQDFKKHSSQYVWNELGGSK